MAKSIFFIPVVLGLVACAADDGPIEVTVTAREGVALTEASRVTVGVYGHDAGDFSTAPRLVLRAVEAVTALPAGLTLTVGQEALDGIGGRVELMVDAVYVDVDGDGWICEGELVQDYAVEAPKAFGVGGPEGAIEIAMKRTGAGAGCFEMPTASEHGGGCGGPESDF